MTAMVSVKIVVRNDMDKYSLANLQVTSMSEWNRLLLAAKNLGICWGGALLCVLIPVLHFVLVPLGILLGIIVFIYKAKLRQFVSASEISCPACQSKIHLRAKPFNWPLRETCSQCHSQLQMNANLDL
jgi:hypothetical protein